MIEFLKLFTSPVDTGLLQFGILNSILLPLFIGIILFCIPDRYKNIKGLVALVVSALVIYLAFIIHGTESQVTTLKDIINGNGVSVAGTDITRGAGKYIVFKSDDLSKLIMMFISLFAFLVLLYSITYIKSGRAKDYYSWFLISLGCSVGALFSDNLLLFIAFWGILGITLYKLIPGHDEESSAAAKKTFILIGASDSIMILGIALLWRLTGTLSMDSISLPTTRIISVVAFLALLTGSFTKAGAFPFHTWVPDFAKNAPASSSAYLPASLDKLLGIYFLARITTSLFVLTDLMRVLLLTIGVITIISAVMMALVQHNYKRLLGFHAVSQVGYMILGFGLGSLIGIAAGLFHMINNALYKSGLFLSAGSVEYRTGQEDIDKLGGLSKSMPITFIASLIFAMSISGVPPFNGFASKWMIYQGIIEFGAGAGIASKLWVIWLGLAILGSALTLASFIKFIGGIFLSRRKQAFENVKEVPATMWIPMVILALFCIVFGVFATKYIVPGLFMPITGKFVFAGFWNSSLVSLLVLISISLGIIIYLITSLKRFRMEDSFIGGEKFQDKTGYPTPEFYKTIGEFRFLAWMYRKAEEKWFDLYDLFKRMILWFSNLLSDAHSGLLTSYILWICAGLIIILLILI
jgi:formate hydrogenlyase subunit 3/multisubunit Na+/H+ antiporter MnhD subunit